MALAVVLRVVIAVATRYTAEDYLITLRYAENLANGHGMVYNVGERVLGTTTPLYTMILALAAWMHCSPAIFGKAITILADSALCLLVYLWMRREGLEKAGRIAAFLVAVHPLHIRWAISGMETSLVTAMGIWAWNAFSRRRYTEAYLALGLLFLLRWDSLLLTGVLTTAILLRERRLPLAGLCLFAILVAPWTIVAVRYDGSPIPITGQAKMRMYGWYADHLSTENVRIEAAGSGQGLTKWIQYEPTWLLRRLPRQQKLLNVFVGAPIPLLLTLAAGLGLWQLIRMRKWTMAPAVGWSVLYFTALLLSRIYLFDWYLVPPFPVFDVLAAIGIVACARSALRPLSMMISRGERRSADESVDTRHQPRVQDVVATVLLLGYAAGSTWWLVPVLQRSQRIEEATRIPIGRWLNANSQPTDRILLEPIGYIGYYSQRRIIHVIGLVSPEALPYYSTSATNPWLAQIRDFQPEWCVLRPPEAEDIERAAATQGYAWNSHYRLAHSESYRSGLGEKPVTFLVYRRLSNSLQGSAHEFGESRTIGIGTRTERPKLDKGTRLWNTPSRRRRKRNSRSGRAVSSSKVSSATTIMPIFTRLTLNSIPPFTSAEASSILAVARAVVWSG